MLRVRMHHLCAAAVLTVLCFSASSVLAQDYPSKPVRWVLPFSPGGSGDALARVLGQSLAESLGQPFVIENRPGGNTVVAAVAVAQAEPDGYTVLQAVDSTMTMLPSVYDKLPYKVSDLTPIGMLVEQSQLLASNPQKLSARSFQEFVAYAKSNPGRINFGVGSINSQITAELLKSATGIEVLMVPFKGGGDTIKALLAGTVDVAISDITPGIPLIKAGRLNALATTRIRRAASLPDVPTLAESGYQFNARSWFGLLAPAGTPRHIVLKLNQEVNRVLGLPNVKERLASFGLDPIPTTPEEFGHVIKDEADQWAKLIKERGIKPQ